jgi:head-tail adaptor
MEEDCMSFVGLMNDFVEDCTLLEKTRVPDGEGGWTNSWVDGMEFQAAITYDTTIQARVAESEGMKATYTVTTEKSMPLDFHDVFRRKRDGQIFRVTSQGDDRKTPASASFQVSQVAAEEWALS